MEMLSIYAMGDKKNSRIGISCGGCIHMGNSQNGLRYDACYGEATYLESNLKILAVSKCLPCYLFYKCSPII